MKKKEEGTPNDEEDEVPDEFTEEDEQLRTTLTSEGWSKWTKKDFAKFLRACEIYGLYDYENINKILKNKTPEEVESYTKIFADRIDDLPNGQRILAKINKFETEKNKIIEFQEIVDKLYLELSESYDDIFTNLKIPYKAKGKLNNDQ